MDIYDRDGKPITLEEWAENRQSLEDKRVEYTELEGHQVSTVWLGLDHNFSGEGPPLIFETMVFPSDGWGELDCNRYATLGEAKMGHYQMVNKWVMHLGGTNREHICPRGN